jgi:uncharacterized protein YggE
MRVTKLSVLPLWLLATLAQAQSAGVEPARGITVSGTGTVSAAPDRARVQLTVQRSNAIMGTARSEALAVVERFLDLTRKLGIETRHVRTTSAMVNPEYRWEQPSGRQVLTGYSVQRQLEVEVTDLDKLGPLIEGAVSAGVTNVTPPSLYSSRRRELNREALAAAAVDARRNAEAIAAALGVKVGALRELVAGDATPPPPPGPLPRLKVAAMAESMDAGATYEPGSLDYEAHVNATFDLVAP